MGKKNASDTFKSQEKVSLLSILSELPNLVAHLIFAALSGSLMIALDTVESASNFIQFSLSFFLSKKLQGDDRFRYDYGMGKIEAFGSLLSSVFLFLGLAAVFAASVYALIIPSIPREALLLAILLKIINVSVDIFLLYRQVTTVKGVDGGFIKANALLLKKNLISDLVSLLTITLSFAFRSVDGIVYFEPLICIACAIYIASQNLKIMKEASADLLDKTLDEDTQLKILKCVSGVWEEINEFHGVRTRRSGHILFIDLMVSFDGDSSYSKIYRTYEAFDNAVKEILPGSVSAIVIGESKTSDR